MSIKNIINGLIRIKANKTNLYNELDNHWEVLAEGVQTILRKSGNDSAYEKLKELTRGHTVDRELLSAFINDLEISTNDKKYAYAFTDCFLEVESRGKRKKIFNLFEQMFINQIPYSIFIPRKVFIEQGFYDENMKLGYEDWELNIRLASRNVFGKSISKPLFHYNVSDSGMLISKSIRNHIKIWKSSKQSKAIL